MGRRTKLTPELIERARELKARGLSNEALAAALGISEGTFYNWKSKAEKRKSGVFLEFLEAIKKGEREFEAACVNGIFEQGQKGNWQALAWLLERLFPERYSKKDVTTIEHKEPLRIVIERISARDKNSDH
ncbi:transposase [Atrimonas thermophila]|uniref:transposase n=1 Tax=Atrimonas thermophila TaxID=3064161 RepID=UPI00399CF404